MERSLICASCLSKFPEIHGMIYADKSPVGRRCEDEWHKGVGYHPEILHLTEDDKVFLTKQYISIE